MVCENRGDPDRDGYTAVDVSSKEGVLEALAFEVEEFDRLRFAAKTLSAALDDLRVHIRDDRPYPQEMLLAILKGMDMLGGSVVRGVVEATSLITTLMCRMLRADTPPKPAA